MLITLLTIVYVVCVLLLTAFAIGSVAILISYLRHRNDLIPPPEIAELPTAAVQLPVYNEYYVVERLLKACAELDYPRDKLIIQVLDDSTDETTELVAALTERWRAQGIDVRHVRRDNRDGFKAGALAYGLSLIDCEMTAVFDADFMPAPDFLKRAVSHLVANPKLAAVQGRWGHLNSQQNPLTQAVTLALDGHFIVEQTARSRAGWLMNFNGSAGVWRVKAIEDAGGWRDTTLTEDMDLSYRAQLKGWRLLYLPDLVVPGEIPPMITAYKQQQARWAQGGTQCFRHWLIPVWRHPGLTLMQRLMATMHLAQYVVHPIIILVILLTPPLLIAHSLQQLNLGVLGMASIAPPLIFIVSQQALHGDWKKRMFSGFPLLLVLGTGIAWSNSRAVIRGLLDRHDEFLRTPKFAQKLRGNAYALRLNDSTFWEIVLSLYTAWGAWTALRLAPSLVLYLLIYCFAFGIVAFWDVRDSWLMRSAV